MLLVSITNLQGFRRSTQTSLLRSKKVYCFCSDIFVQILFGRPCINAASAALSPVLQFTEMPQPVLSLPSVPRKFPHLNRKKQPCLALNETNKNHLLKGQLGSTQFFPIFGSSKRPPKHEFSKKSYAWKPLKK